MSPKELSDLNFIEVQSRVLEIASLYDQLRYVTFAQRFTYRIDFEDEVVEVVQRLCPTDGYDSFRFPLEWVFASDWEAKVRAYVKEYHLNTMHEKERLERMELERLFQKYKK